MDDLEALRRFTEAGDAGAFQEIVRRHVDLVYSAARRQMRDAAGAEDVTQGVFLLLMHKAGGLARGSRLGLAGWLLTATHFACRAARRAEARRVHHERKAMRMRRVAVDAVEAGWDEIARALDGALMGLPARDRAAVGMRCLEERTFVEVGAALGISEEAARKRVERALEKLRTVLARQGVVAPAGLAGMLAAHGVEKSPSSVVAGLALHTDAGSHATAIAKGTAKLLRWAQLKMAAIAGAGVVVLGVMTGVATFKGHAAPAAPVTVAASAPAAHPLETTGLGAMRVGDKIVFNGEVVDAQGKAVAGAAYRVFDFHLWPGYVQEAQGVTAADGHFSTGPVVPDPPSNLSRQIVIDAPGYAYAWWSPISSDPVWRPQRIQLEPARRIEGVVRSEAGKPVAGATIEVDAQSPAYGFCSLNSQCGVTVTTDAGGKFVFDRIPATARMHILARKEGYATTSTVDGYHADAYPITPGTTDVELTMRPEALVRGQLMHEGKPVAIGGVVIQALEEGWRYLPVRARTDAQGRVELRGLGAGTWDLAPPGRDGTQDERRVLGAVVKVAAGDVLEVTFSYDEGVLLEGVVHDAAGHPVRETVSLSRTDQKRGEDRELTPDASGKFSARVLPGKYLLSVFGRAAGHPAEVDKTVEVGTKPVEGVEIVVEPVPVVKGQLVDGTGKGVAGMVAFQDDCVYTDEEGHFERPAPEENDKQTPCVAVDALGKLGVGFMGELRDADAARLVLEPMGAITGRIVDGAGNGVGDAKVFVQIGNSGAELSDGRWLWGIQLKGDGTYRIAPVPTGYDVLNVIAERDGWQGMARVEAPAPGEDRAKDVVLHPPGATTRGAQRKKQVIPPALAHDAHITGRLLDTKGAPLVGWRISWLEGLEDASTSTDLKGRFALEGLPAGRSLRVKAWLEGRQAEWDVETGKEGVELKVSP